jgi:hypothetical protein
MNARADPTTPIDTAAISEPSSTTARIHNHETSRPTPAAQPRSTFLNRDVRNVIYRYLTLPRLIRTEDAKASVGLSQTSRQFQQEI